MTDTTRSAEESIIDFIGNYLEEHTATDCLDAEFHDEFTIRFGGRRKNVYPGAATNRLAMQWLGKLYREGMLIRSVISFGDTRQMGFPNWVYTYELSGIAKRLRASLQPYIDKRQGAQ